jgi:hypothetical protein
VRGVLAVVIWAGCYGPTFPDGSPCTTAHECPGSLTCSHGLCVAHAQPDDSGSGSDTAACTPIVVGHGALTAPRVTSIKLDGDLSDWPTCFITLDASTAIIRDITGLDDYSTGRFSIAHDDNSVYIAAEVTGVPPLGDQPVPAIYQNDSIAVYLDADGVFTTATYDPDAIQIVVDHAGRSQAFHSSETVPANLGTATRTIGNTFTIEMAIQPSTLSATAFGSTIGFDIGFESGDGTTQTSELIWFESCGPPTCGCANGDSAPYCDARELGTATLAP